MACSLRDLGLAPTNPTLFEIGAQEVREEFTLDELKALFEEFGNGHNPTLREYFDMCQAPTPRKLFSSLGFEYHCFDIYEGPGITLVDLNRDSVPDEFRGRADIVTNFGTTEHILNQLNCFQFTHDLTAVGGLQWHSVPMSDHFTHGFFKYDCGFFMSLAQANNYHIKYLRFHNVEGEFPIPELMLENGFPPIESRRSSQTVMLQKQEDRPFQIPLDLDVNQGISPKLLEPYKERLSSFQS